MITKSSLVGLLECPQHNTPLSWSTSGWKATSIATNHIKFFSFLWAFTWYHSWKEVCGSKSYIFKIWETTYFLKLLCLLKTHKHCQVGKMYQLKVQITESFKREVFSIQIDFFFYLPKNGVKSALREHYYFHT